MPLNKLKKRVLSQRVIMSRSKQLSAVRPYLVCRMIDLRPSCNFKISLAMFFMWIFTHLFFSYWRMFVVIIRTFAVLIKAFRTTLTDKTVAHSSQNTAELNRTAKWYAYAKRWFIPQLNWTCSRFCLNFYAIVKHFKHDSSIAFLLALLMIIFYISFFCVSWCFCV